MPTCGFIHSSSSRSRHRHEPANALRDAVLASDRAFTGGPFADDATLIAAAVGS